MALCSNLYSSFALYTIATRRPRRSTCTNIRCSVFVLTFTLSTVLNTFFFKMRGASKLRSQWHWHIFHLLDSEDSSASVDEWECSIAGSMAAAVGRLARHEQRHALGLVPLARLPALITAICKDCLALTQQTVEVLQGVNCVKLYFYSVGILDTYYRKNGDMIHNSAVCMYVCIRFQSLRWSQFSSMCVWHC